MQQIPIEYLLCAKNFYRWIWAEGWTLWSLFSMYGQWKVKDNNFNWWPDWKVLIYWLAGLKGWWPCLLTGKRELSWAGLMTRKTVMWWFWRTASNVEKTADARLWAWDYFSVQCGFLGTLRAYMYGTSQHGIIQGVENVVLQTPCHLC